MARAFICLCRNDLDDNLLQALDLVPYTSQNLPSANPGGGQSGYLSFDPQYDHVTTADIGAGVWRTTIRDNYGLVAYIMDNCENGAGGLHLRFTDAQAQDIAYGILDRLGLGLSLTLVDVTVIVTGLGFVLGADTTMTIPQILRILSGEAYKLPLGSTMSGAANAWLTTGPGATHLPVGYFVTAPIVVADGHDPALGQPGRSFKMPINRPTTQTGTHDTTYRHIRTIYDTPDLHRSVCTPGGRLGQLYSEDFEFHNAQFTYGATGNAIKFRATHIAEPPSVQAYKGRALVVYAEDGTVI